MLLPLGRFSINLFGGFNFYRWTLIQVLLETRLRGYKGNVRRGTYESNDFVCYSIWLRRFFPTWLGFMDTPIVKKWTKLDILKGQLTRNRGHNQKWCREVLLRNRRYCNRCRILMELERLGYQGE